MKLDVNLNMCTLFIIYERAVCVDTSKAESKAKGKRTHNLFKVFKKACEWMHAVGKCVGAMCENEKYSVVSS